MLIYALLMLTAALFVCMAMFFLPFPPERPFFLGWNLQLQSTAIMELLSLISFLLAAIQGPFLVLSGRRNAFPEKYGDLIFMFTGFGLISLSQIIYELARFFPCSRRHRRVADENVEG